MSIDTVLGIIGTVLGVVGIGTGYYFYVKGNKTKELCWSEDEVKLIKGFSTLFKDLKIKYKGQDIENLTVSKIAIWNNGSLTIDKADIATASPLAIEAFDNTKILDAKVLEVTNPVNRFTVNLEESGEFAFLAFDYLDSNQGAVLQVIHTGIQLVNIMVTGEIKGVEKIRYKTKKPDRVLEFSRYASYLYLVVLWAFSVGLIYIYYFDTNNKMPTLVLSVPVFTLILTIVFYVLDISKLKNRARIPKKLSEFYNDDIHKLK